MNEDFNALVRYGERKMFCIFYIFLGYSTVREIISLRLGTREEFSLLFIRSSILYFLPLIILSPLCFLLPILIRLPSF